jgi:hypothetical protein
MSEFSAGNALSVLEELATDLPAGAALSFVTFGFAPHIENRGRLEPAEKAAVATGLRLRETFRLPFWEGVLLAASTGECTGGDGLIEAAEFHQTIGSRRTWLSVREVEAARLETMCADAQQSGQMLAVTSAIRMPDGVIQHVPMMDFHLAYSSPANALLIKLVSRWEIPGALLRSGKSYHFYGRTLLDQTGLARFLGRALLYTPIVDRAWIAHQLIEQSCALRISARPEYGGTPTLLTRFSAVRPSSLPPL